MNWPFWGLSFWISGPTRNFKKKKSKWLYIILLPEETENVYEESYGVKLWNRKKYLLL